MPKSADPDPDALDADDDLRSRTDARKERLQSEEELMDLAGTLVGLSERSLSKLELPEPLLDAIQKARAIQSPPARKRALRAVRSELRSGEARQIQKSVRDLTRPKPPSNPELDAWCTRLVEGGDAELGRFLEAHPDSDRQQLRTLARSAAKAAPEARDPHLRSLKQALTRYLK